jgi:apolipoprotein D and lipocalin family protein
MKLRRVLVAAALLVGAAAALYSCTDMGGDGRPALTTAQKIDLQRYMGAWYVIANIPYFAERGKVATRDVYQLDTDGNIDTTFVYRKSFDSPEQTVSSLGVVQPGTNNAYWIVRFFWLIRADYLIVDIAPDYSWVLVGQPSRKLGWILARDPAMGDTQYASLVEKFHRVGYEPAQFQRVAQFAEQIGKPGFQ